MRANQEAKSRATRRAGAVIVETAFVFVLFMLFVYSIFEYGRMVMLRHLIVNAAREGCRYAVVHSTDTTIIADVQTKVKARLAGQQSQFPDLLIQTYPSTTPASANVTSAINNLQPDDDVTVRVTGTFKTMFPTLLFLPVSLQMKSSCIMTCEGN